MKREQRKKVRRGRVHIRFLPVIVWAAAVVCVVMLFQQQSREFEILGLAQAPVHQIQATNVARLKSISVELFQEVKAGQVLAVLDPVIDPQYEQAKIQAERAVIEAEIQRLQAQLEAAREDLTIAEADRETDLATKYQQFSVDIQRAQLRILELKTVLEPDRINLKELETNIKMFVAQTPMDTDTAPYELEKIKLQRASLEKKIEENERLLSQSEENLLQTQQQRDELAKMHSANLTLNNTLKPIQEAINVQAKKMEQLMVQRQPVLLTAPMAGLVSEIHLTAGELALLGNPVITIAEDRPREIAAWTTEAHANIINQNMQVKIVKRSQPPQIAPGQVVYVGPTLEMVPQRLWTNLNMPQWGRRILIQVNADMKMIPGEVVGVKGL
jgi:multidrug efflux pump subunit AcrA (membrane-fusion protein)